jgi:hypothetical protein
MVVSGGGMTKMKHMKTRMHLILEAMKENRVEIKPIGSKGMKADGFTKSLDGTSFMKFRSESLHLSD